MKNIQLMKSVIKIIMKFKKYLNNLIKCVEKYILYDINQTNWKLTKKKIII
jgi:hypothetical protein